MAFTMKRKAAYCEALIEACGNREEAARRIGISRATAANHYASDPEFRGMFEGAMELYRYSLIKSAHERGVIGTKKPIFFKGRRAWDRDEYGNEWPAFVREYDTPLLLALLKRHCPEFKDKITVENRNVNLDMGLKDIADMTPDQRAKLRELIDLPGEPDEQPE